MVFVREPAACRALVRAREIDGRAVEAAGDVNTLLLDKTGTITLGNRQATEFMPAPDVSQEGTLPTCIACTSANTLSHGH